MTKLENSDGLIIIGETASDSSSFVQSDTSLGDKELSLDEQREQAAQQKQRLAEINERLVKDRNDDPNAIKLSSSPPPLTPTTRTLRMFAVDESVAAEFTLGGQLPDIGDGRTNTVRAASYFETTDGNDYTTLTFPKWERTTEDPQYDGTQDYIYLWSVHPPENPEISDELVYRIWPEPVAGFTQPVVDDGPFTVSIPPAFFAKYPEGPVDILYSVANESINNHTKSLAQTIYLDKRPPSYLRDPAPLVPPANIPAGVITKAILDANTDFPFNVPVYPLAWEGDRIRVYDRDSREVLYEGPIWPVTDAARLDMIRLLSSALRKLGEGPKAIVYKLIDRTGWESSESEVYRVTIQLEPQPTVLPAPLIKTVPINREVLRGGVKIELPVIANALPDDQIVMHLISPTGDKQLPPFRYSDGFTTATWDDIAVPDGQAVYRLEARYELKRGTATHGPSTPAFADVNLKTVGPGPIDPGPINTSLLPLLIRGGVIREDNKIGPGDAGTAAIVTFTVPDNAMPGQVIDFFYDTVFQGKHVITASEIPGSTVPLTLDWSSIRDRGNGIKLAYYTIYDPALPGNFQQSPNTPVDVTANTIAVTTAVEYEYLKADFQNKAPGSAVTTTGIINCAASPWRGVRVKVRLTDTIIAAGDTLRLDWVFALDARGITIKESSRLHLDVPVTQAHLNSKLVSILVPYNQINFGGQENGVDVLEGSIVCFYTVTKPNNIIGISIKTMARYSAKQTGSRCVNWVD